MLVFQISLRFEFRKNQCHVLAAKAKAIRKCGFDFLFPHILGLDALRLMRELETD